MRRYAIWIDGDINLQRVAEALRDAGIHLHCRNGLMLADVVPGIVRRDEPVANVVPLARRKGRK